MNYFITDKLSDDQRRSAQAFAAKLETDLGIVFKLDASVFTPQCYPNHGFAFAYNGKSIAAFASLANWGKDEPEGTLVCRNEDLREFAAFILENLPRETKTFFAISDRRSIAASEVFKALNLKHTKMERQLVLNTKKFIPPNPGAITIRKAQAADIPLIEEFDLNAWGEKYPISNEALAGTIFGMENDKCIVKLVADADSETGVCGIFGFAVKPELRGKGYGKAFLGKVIGNHLKDGYRRIYLQADEDNVVANSLYEKLGFELECELDYYAR